MSELKARCVQCGGVEKYETLEDCKSVCCGAQLVQVNDLPVCERTVTAEQERIDEVDGPCDDATDRS